jgi:chemotaxis family two-component system sensor kinase Cph1
VQSEKKALQGGFSAFRWAADMTWLRKDEIEPVDMFFYEAELNRLLAEHELVGFCQYAMDDFRSELLIAAAETHPLLVYNDLVCDNFYFIPPEEYLKPRFSDVKLKRILYNIVSRERLMSNFLFQ